MNVATIAVKALKENGKMVDVVESEETNACTYEYRRRRAGLGSVVKNETQSPYGNRSHLVELHL